MIDCFPNTLHILWHSVQPWYKLLWANGVYKQNSCAHHAEITKLLLCQQKDVNREHVTVTVNRRVGRSPLGDEKHLTP